jgi:hypothetical protein
MFDTSYLTPLVGAITTINCVTASSRNAVPSAPSLYILSTTNGFIKFGDGNVAAAIGTASAAAVGTLTSAGVFNNNDTVTIGTTVYTFKTALTPAAYEVLIGANQTASHQNLFDAINLTGTPGTQYGAATSKHPTVEATSATGTTTVLAAKTPGTGGNSIATTETGANISFGGGTLASGTNGVATSLPLAAFVPLVIRNPGYSFIAAIRSTADGVVTVQGLG